MLAACVCVCVCVCVVIYECVSKCPEEEADARGGGLFFKAEGRELPMNMHVCPAAGTTVPLTICLYVCESQCREKVVWRNRGLLLHVQQEARKKGGFLFLVRGGGDWMRLPVCGEQGLRHQRPTQEGETSRLYRRKALLDKVCTCSV